MSRLKYNGVGTTLSSSLSNSATTLPLSQALASGGTNIPTIAAPDFLPLSIAESNGGKMTEIVYVTAYTSGATTATIVRGREGTSGVVHAAGDRVVNAPLVFDLTDIPSGYDDFSSGWSWVNQGSAVLAVAAPAAALTFPTGSRFSHALRVKTNAGGNLTLTAKFPAPAAEEDAFIFYGLALRNSSSGKFISWGYWYDVNKPWIGAFAWQDATQIGTGGGLAGGQIAMTVGRYFRIRVASGTVHFEMSLDNVNWIDLGTTTVATYLGTYDQVGFHAHNDTGTPAIGLIEWLTIA